MQQVTSSSASSNQAIQQQISITRTILIIIVLYILSCVLVVYLEQYRNNSDSSLSYHIVSTILRHVVLVDSERRRLETNGVNQQQWWWYISYWLLRLGRQNFYSPSNNNDANAYLSVMSSQKYRTSYSGSVTPFPGKKGVGFVLSSNGYGSYDNNLPKVLALDVYWNYGWSLKRIEDQPSSPQFIPMAWNGGSSLSDLQSKIYLANIPNYILNGTVQYMMGYNEPDKSRQANMDVAVAIDRWIALQELGIPLVSPSAAQPAGTWMQQFMGNATALNLRMDYLGVHMYSGTNYDNFVSKLTYYYNLYGLPLVLTEFAPADWSAQDKSENRHTPEAVLSFMKQALPWLESTSWIIAYSWFSFKDTDPKGWSSALFNSTTGNLTAAGLFYKSVQSNNIYGDQSIQFE